MDASSVILAAALATAQTAAVRSKAAATPKGPTLIDSISPAYVYHPEPVPGALTGLLVDSYVSGVCFIDHNQTIGKQNPGNPSMPCIGSEAYWLGRPGKAPMHPELPVAGPAFGSARLVRLEIDGGKGAPAADDVKATSVQTLDRSAAYPLDAAALVEGFLKPYGDPASAQSKVIDSDLSAAVQALQSAEPDYGQDTKTMSRETRTQDGFTAYWIPATQTLRVAYYRRYEDVFSQQGYSRHGRGEVPPQLVTLTHVYGAERAVVAEYAKDGSFKSQATRTASYAAKNH